MATLKWKESVLKSWLGLKDACRERLSKILPDGKEVYDEVVEMKKELDSK